MPSTAYRYQFEDSVPAEDIEATLVLSLFAVEALHGEAQTRLDATHALDHRKRAVVIDGSTEVGVALNRVFISLVTREFGPGRFRVKRVQEKAQPEPVTA